MNAREILSIIDGSAIGDTQKLASIKLLAERNGNSEWLLNRREDTGQYLGVVSKDYKILDNEEIIGAVESALVRRTDLGNFQRDVFVLGNGEKMVARYSFPSFVLKSAKVGDSVGFGFEVRNSFDRTWVAALLGYLKKLACLNGMTTVSKELELMQRHSRNLSLTFINAMIDRAIDVFKASIGNFENMADVSLTQIEGRNVIAYTAERLTGVSVATAKAVAAIWERPTYNEDSPRNMMSLYSAFTQHLRDETSYLKTDKINRAVTGLFSRAIKTPNVMFEMTAQRDTEFLLN